MVHVHPFSIAMSNYQRVSIGPSWNIIFHAPCVPCHQEVGHKVHLWWPCIIIFPLFPIVWMEEILHQLIGGLSQHFIIQRLSTIQGGAGLLPSTISIKITIWDTPFRHTPRNRVAFTAKGAVDLARDLGPLPFRSRTRFTPTDFYRHPRNWGWECRHTRQTSGLST